MGYYVIKKSEKSVSQPWYFLLKADNHETIATSEMYSSKEAAKKELPQCRRMVPAKRLRMKHNKIC
jgi:uncharacterized protein YegP (UPF0339 family)